MYIDEAGVEVKRDQTKFFVVSGAIFHEDHITDMKNIVQSFKNTKFNEKYKNNEIHVHDIYKGKKEFLGITLPEIDSILTELYTMINSLEFSTISVAIDKPSLAISSYSHYDILETAYKFLAERYDNFLRKTENKGVIRIDRTSNKSNTSNKKDDKILN